MHKPEEKKMEEFSRSHTDICPHTLLIYRSIWGTCQRWKSECLPKHRVKRNRHLSEKRRMHFTGLHGEVKKQTRQIAHQFSNNIFLCFDIKKNKENMFNSWFFYFFIFYKNEPEDFIYLFFFGTDQQKILSHVKMKRGSYTSVFKKTNKQMYTWMHLRWNRHILYTRLNGVVFNNIKTV